MTEPRLDPALHAALLKARERREQRGAGKDGTVALSSLGPAEALALDGLLAPRRPILPGRPLRMKLSQFEAALSACGIDPLAAYEAVGGSPIRDIPAERAAVQATHAEFRTWLAAHPVARSRPAVRSWLEEAADKGRITADTRRLVERALRVVAALPAAEPMQRTVLAAQLLDGDPHALDPGGALHRLTVTLLTVAAGLRYETSPREVWAAWNVVVDPISSAVVVLNPPLVGEGRVAHLARVTHGTHLVLTYGQLSAEELRWPQGVECFSCENPSVLIAAEAALGEACPPMLCTGGRPSDAVRLLLSSLSSAGAHICHHGDFDEAGVQILRDLEARYGVMPWRFDVAALRAVVGAPDEAWATLEEAVGALEDCVAEELVIGELVEDLGAAARALSTARPARSTPPRTSRARVQESGFQDGRSVTREA